MSVIAVPAVAAFLIVSTLSGTIAGSLNFLGTNFAANTENDKVVQNDDSKEDDGLSQSVEYTSQSGVQKSEIDPNGRQTVIAPDDLSLRVERLEIDNFYLKSKLNSAIVENEEMKIQYQTLKTKYAEVLESNSDLEELISYYQERITFQNDNALILKNKLSESISPPYTFIKSREIFWLFKDSHGNTRTWSIPIDTYRAIIERPEPQEEKILRSDSGREYRVRDHTKFVDSAAFSLWMDDVFENTISSRIMNSSSNDSLLFYEAWYIASQLTEYTPDLDEDPRWPLETLVEGGGDCEDFAILLASMLKASQHTKDWQIQMVYFDIDHRDSPKEVNHVSLFIKTDEFETYVDRSLDPSKNESWEYVQGWYFDI